MPVDVPFAVPPAPVVFFAVAGDPTEPAVPELPVAKAVYLLMNGSPNNHLRLLKN